MGDAMNVLLGMIFLGIATVSAQLPQVATPVSIPPGRAFLSPLSVLLASITPGSSILYTTDGTTPSATVSGSTKLYAGVLSLSATTTIKAMAVKDGQSNSAVMSESFVYNPPATVVRGHYLDSDGDGRIESAVVIFDKELPALPEKLGFTLILPVFETQIQYITGTTGIAFAPESKNRVMVSFADPFPFGLTSVANSATSGRVYAQSNPPLLDGPFAMQDSVPPVLTKAEYKGGSGSFELPSITLTVSEPLKDADFRSMAVFKRGNAVVEQGRTGIVLVQQIRGATEFVLRLDSASDFLPMTGDSVALNSNGVIEDLTANSPSRFTFIPLIGEFPMGMAAGAPGGSLRGSKMDLDWVLSGRILRGKSLSLHPPRSLACYGVDGGRLGMAKPAGASGVWELPAGKRAMVLILEMPDGSRRKIRLRP
jgi:hypothetical protein